MKCCWHDGSLTLDLLPYGYMPDHTRRWHAPVSLWYSFDRKQKKWARRLAAEGLTMDNDHPAYIRNRYAGIAYADL